MIKGFKAKQGDNAAQGVTQCEIERNDFITTRVNTFVTATNYNTTCRSYSPANNFNTLSRSVDHTKVSIVVGQQVVEH